MSLINIVFFVSTLVLLVESAGNSNSSLKVSVYYESLCPDSIDFIKDQLSPNYENLKDYIAVDFVPYGFAKKTKNSSGAWTLTCQHGYKECRGNKYHACALDQQKGRNKDVAFISCSMTSADPSDEGLIKNCANNYGYDWTALSTCYNGDRGDELIEKYGEKTISLNPKFIPSIVFNDKFDQTLQDESISNFLEAACSQISQPKPDVCN